MEERRQARLGEASEEQLEWAMSGRLGGEGRGRGNGEAGLRTGVEKGRSGEGVRGRGAVRRVKRSRPSLWS